MCTGDFSFLLRVSELQAGKQLGTQQTGCRPFLKMPAVSKADPLSLLTGASGSKCLT